MGWSSHELCKSCTTSWGFCSPACAQWPENLHLSPEVQHYSLHFWACEVKIQLSFWATDPASSPTVWPGHTYQLHHCNDGTAHTASKVTAVRYSVVFQICIPLKAWAVSRVFLKWTQRFEPLELLWGFLGRANSGPFLEVISGRLPEKKKSSFLLWVLAL